MQSGTLTLSFTRDVEKIHTPRGRPPGKSFTCPVSGCYICFTRRYTVKMHLLSIHKHLNPRSAYPEYFIFHPAQERFRDKVFECPHPGCGRFYTLKGNCQAHYRRNHIPGYAPRWTRPKDAPAIGKRSYRGVQLKNLERILEVDESTLVDSDSTKIDSDVIDAVESLLALGTDTSSDPSSPSSGGLERETSSICDLERETSSPSSGGLEHETFSPMPKYELKVLSERGISAFRQFHSLSGFAFTIDGQIIWTCSCGFVAILQDEIDLHISKNNT
jgi:hypothetical protein